MIDNYTDIKALLDEEAAKINSPDFINDDPVQFPRLFSKKQDIEIASVLSATVAWGKRSMICRDISRMMALMEWQPYKYTMEKGYEDLPDGDNIHRTFFTRNLRHYLRGLRNVYSRHESLEDFAAARGCPASEMPAWHLVEALNRVLRDANNGVCDSRCTPQNLQSTALKRINMALRWLVRDDGIVDMGIWSCMKPAQLYIPLDVHVGNTSRNLGILTRMTDDKKAVVELTENLRMMRPHDPVFYDYALFGIGVNKKVEWKEPLMPEK